MKKKLLSLSLAILMAAASLTTLAACASGGNSSTTTVDDSAADPNRVYLDDLPDDLDFEGVEIVIAYCEGDDGPFTQRSIEADPDSADSVDSAIFERNKSVENRLNVKLVPAKMSTNLKSTVESVLVAGDDTYDIVAGYQYADLNMALSGVITNLSKMENKYINPEKDYWATEYIDGINYKGSIYWVTGDLALRFMGGMFCTYVNATMYNNILQAKYGSIYDIVKSGEWTMDKLAEMASLGYLDTNSNDVTDSEDTLGYVLVDSCVLYSMAISAGVNFSTKDSDGNVSLAINSEKTIDYAGKLFKMKSSRYTYMANSYPTELTLFAGGNVLFTNNKVHQAEIYMQDMKEDYYVIPCPKLDTNQKTYFTYIHNACTIYGIPTTSDCVDAAAAALEALSSESERLVKSVYYDKALKFGYTRDPEAAEMIDLMRETVRGDFVLAWTKSVGEVSEIFRGNTSGSKFSSTLKRNQNVYQTALNTLIADLEALES